MITSVETEFYEKKTCEHRETNESKWRQDLLCDLRVHLPMMHSSQHTLLSMDLGAITIKRSFTDSEQRLSEYVYHTNRYSQNHQLIQGWASHLFVGRQGETEKTEAIWPAYTDLEPERERERRGVEERDREEGEGGGGRNEFKRCLF